MATYIGTTGDDSQLTGYDYLYGADGNDTLASDKAGLDVVEGGKGTDYIFIASGVSGVGHLYGGDDNDTAFGNTLADSLYGGEGNDLLMGGVPDSFPAGGMPLSSAVSGNDYFEGGNGTDAIYGYDGNDVIYGGDGDDSATVISVAKAGFLGGGTMTVLAGLYGGDGNDYIDGGRGNDALYGGNGNDQMVGGYGNDILYGGTGTDEMIGGVGDDTYEVDNVGDVCKEADGADGIDKVFAYVDYTLPDAVDNLIMSFGNQTYGIGNGANNIIIGNAQSNYIEGKAGYDVLTGGAGSDFFVVNPNWYVDVITDFTPGAGTQDAVLFSKAIFQTYGQVIANSAQVGADVYIGDGYGDTVVLQNVTLAQLHPDDFGFF